jgi:hypothetical protein
MKSRFILFLRGEVYYCEDTVTRKQSSLRTRDKTEAASLLNARNEAFRQPVLNLQLARTYLTATDPEVAKRTWLTVIRFGRKRPSSLAQGWEALLLDPGA